MTKSTRNNHGDSSVEHEKGTLERWKIPIMAVGTILVPILLFCLKDCRGPDHEPPQPPLAAEYARKVSGDDYWRETDVIVEKGDWLEFKATGRWWSGISNTGPDGDGGLFGLGRPSSSQCPVVDANLGALVGKVEGDAPFRIGSQHQVIATKSGQLYLAMNDNTGSLEGGGPGSCYADNKGVISVVVTVRRWPDQADGTSSK